MEEYTKIFKTVFPLFARFGLYRWPSKPRENSRKAADKESPFPAGISLLVEMNGIILGHSSWTLEIFNNAAINSEQIKQYSVKQALIPLPVKG